MRTTCPTLTHFFIFDIVNGNTMSDKDKIKKMEKRLKKLENVVFKKSTSGGKPVKSSKD